MTHTIHTNELRRLRTAHSDLLLIDVMPKATFDKDHIHGARNIPVDSADFVAAVGRVAGRKDRKIVVYCAGESCDASKRAAAKLVAGGYVDATAYEGGLSAWRHDVAQSNDASDGKAEALVVAHPANAAAAAKAGHPGNAESAQSATASVGRGSPEQ